MDVYTHNVKVLTCLRVGSAAGARLLTTAYGSDHFCCVTRDAQCSNDVFSYYNGRTVWNYRITTALPEASCHIEACTFSTKSRVVLALRHLPIDTITLAVGDAGKASMALTNITSHQPVFMVPPNVPQPAPSQLADNGSVLVVAYAEGQVYVFRSVSSMTLAYKREGLERLYRVHVADLVRSFVDLPERDARRHTDPALARASKFTVALGPAYADAAVIALNRWGVLLEMKTSAPDVVAATQVVKSGLRIDVHDIEPGTKAKASWYCGHFSVWVVGVNNKRIVLSTAVSSQSSNVVSVIDVMGYGLLGELILPDWRGLRVGPAYSCVLTDEASPQSFSALALSQGTLRICTAKMLSNRWTWIAAVVDFSGMRRVAYRPLRGNRRRRVVGNV